jgi:hypothetical protein
MRVSNNSLVVLLVVAIVASFGGTFFSLNFLDNYITGAATTTGNVTLTISSTADCNATDALVAFGSIAQGSSNTSGLANLDFIVLENTGNVNINITSHATVELFSSYSAPTSYWRIHCNATQSGNCNTTWHNVEDSGSPAALATAVPFGDSTDELNVSINVTIPNDESEGAKNGEITFTCTSA